ncbi:MAG: aldehyde dehydrogenase family protein [Deltaproteobacteria bacterium]|jgi:acyl-CoA reductase-like NAD-dependent aldehyde dehydrogenase|nr:aldehyde dehydrogenase family protein [Deltaproteobacteria bacterium]
MDKLQITAPFDNKIIKEIPFASSLKVEKAVELAFQTHKDINERLPKYRIIEILQKLIHLMITQKESIVELAAKEGGKPWVDTQIEVDRAIQGIHIAINEIENLSGTQIPMGHTKSSENRLAFTTLEPRGVVLAISAFNHPVNLIVHQAIPAIAAGCPVIIKPASTTPLSCINLINLLYRAGLPEKYCQVLITTRKDAEKLVSDKRISFLTFIGSGKVGWRLRAMTAPGVHCALEHGGAAPVIVEKDADIDKMIPSLLKGGYYHAGQVCVSVQRVYVHESIIDEVQKKFTPRVKELIVGDPLSRKTEVGPLISPKEVDRVEQWVSEAEQSGGEILCGGKRISDTLYEPTIILNPDENTKVSTKEIFGPVVCFYTYSLLDDAVKIANALPYSFQAAIFTKDINKAFYAVQRLKSEAVMVNDHTAFRVDWMPFGGSEQSGLGTGGIGYSIKDMTREKLMILNLS